MIDSRRIGILGGGQLGRMLVEAAHRLNLTTVILDADYSPAKQINALRGVNHVNGSFSSRDDILALAQDCDLLTTEIEHVDASVLEDIEKEGRVEVQPSSQTIRIIQDKYLQKEFLQSHNVATAESVAIKDNVTVESIGEKFGYPFMLKSRTLAYDGRGNYAVMGEEDVKDAITALKDRPLYAEKWAEFKIELAVMVVKQKDGKCLSYPTVETVHENNICKLVYAPARGISETIRQEARKLAERAVEHLPGAGIFGVEMFLLQDGETLLINEIAPRPHNSGHYTIETHATSQYEAHLRAILGLPLPPTIVSFRTPSTHAIMLNLLGGPESNSMDKVSGLCLETPGATLHLYGKAESRPGRKMGHVTVVAGDMATAESYISTLVLATDYSKKTPSVQLASTSTTPTHRASSPVAVIMGSDSDLPIMAKAVRQLSEFGIEVVPQILSAHRTPSAMIRFAKEAESRGVRVIIAGAGGAAHLPGMVASETTLPVIGVPIKGSVLDGMDSLLSIVQMPPGIPVGTMGINKAENAALYAVKILGTGDEHYRQKFADYMSKLEQAVLAKDQKLQEIEMEPYLKEMAQSKKP